MADLSNYIPSSIKTKKELSAYIKGKNGGNLLPKDEYEDFIKAAGWKPAATTKRKRKSGATRTRRTRRRTGSYGGGGRATQVVYPNIVSGYGGYFADAGGNLGSWLGQRAGKMLGGVADTVFGFGEYNVKSNSLMHSAIDLGSGVPRVINTHKGEAVIINHREFLKDLTSGGSPGDPAPSPFNLETWVNNPGNPETFPWLANIACNFQEYEIRGMLVELKTTSADFSTQLAIGSMFMSANYNVLAPDPSSKREVENMEYASSCKPSSNLIMPIECAPINNALEHLFIAVANSYNGGDRRLYDQCKFHIGSEGLPECGAKIAEIWITYEVALFKPIIPDVTPNVQAVHFTLYNVLAAAPFNGFVLQEGSADDFTINQAADTVTFPNVTAYWLLELHWIAATTGAGWVISPTSYTVGNGAEIAPNRWASTTGIDGGNSINVVETTATDVQNVTSWVIKVTGGSNLDSNPFFKVNGVTIDAGAGAIDRIYGDLYITQLPYDLQS